MKKIYTFFQKRFISATLLLTLISLSASAQVCGPVVEPFTTGGTAGFTGSFSYNAAQQNLRRANVISTSVYVVTTPTYQLLPGSTSLGYGFTLDGTERVSRVEVAVTYVSTLSNALETIFLTQFVPNYGASTTASICRAVETTDLPGFPNGGQYRFRIELSTSTGSGLATQTITFDNFRTNGSISPTPLPVTFIAFDARKISSGAQLSWKVAGEENVNRYEVERSTDGRTFTVVGSVATTKSDTYNYLDAGAGNTVYYRIRNVDNDGKFKYSSIARITNGKSSIVIKAFPQPVIGQLTVQHPVIRGNALLTISSSDGRLVTSRKPLTGSMQTYVDVSLLQRGVYLIRFDDGDGAVETMKVVKQ